jgi:hypothetical protein
MRSNACGSAYCTVVGFICVVVVVLFRSPFRRRIATRIISAIKLHAMIAIVDGANLEGTAGEDVSFEPAICASLTVG